MLLTMRDKEGNSVFLDDLGGKTLFKQRWQFAPPKSTRNQQHAFLFANPGAEILRFDIEGLKTDVGIMSGSQLRYIFFPGNVTAIRFKTYHQGF